VRCVEGAGAGAHHRELRRGGLQRTGLGHTRLVWGAAGIGSGACEAALMRHRGVTRPGDVAVESMAMRVGDARCSDVAATSALRAVATSWPRWPWGQVSGAGRRVVAPRDLPHSGARQRGTVVGVGTGGALWGPCGGVFVFSSAHAAGSWLVLVRCCGRG
jgi:hypothetical protein